MKPTQSQIDYATEIAKILQKDVPPTVLISHLYLSNYVKSNLGNIVESLGPGNSSSASIRIIKKFVFVCDDHK